MKILSLSINNFRGIASESIDAQGRNVNIFACNGAGKTSTEDAFLWLLFGKDSADRKDYDLIPHKLGTPVPDIGCGKEPVVEAKLEYFGKVVLLKKSYIEEWPKRGELKGQYAGSKMHYFVDDLEVKTGKYNSVVNELIDPELFKILTNPHYFSETLSWQERRSTLVKIVGDLNVTPAPELAKLMGERPFDNFYALSKQNVKSTQKQLDGMPYAISEAQRLIPAELPVLPDVAALEKQREDLENQIQTLKNDDFANAVRREIAEVETKIAEDRSKYTDTVNAENEKTRNGIVRLETERREKDGKLADIKAQWGRMQYELPDLTSKKEGKLADWHNVKDSVWTGSDICPTCGQKLPEDQIESAKAAFNKQRSESLERLVKEGKTLAQQIEESRSKIKSFQTESDTLNHDIAVLDQRIEKGRGMLKPCAYETQIEYKQLSGRLTDLKNKLANNADTEKNGKLDALAVQLRGIKEQIQNTDRVKLQIEQAEAQKKHIVELQDQQKKIAADLGKFEKSVALCENHVRKQAHALETAVNGRFKVARFRMFAMQKNGEEAECCDVVYPNGSTNLSTGERLQTGIDIIQTLSEYYGVNAPIWIDNAEGITKECQTDAQIIRLIVSEKDEKLRIEVSDK